MRIVMKLYFKEILRIPCLGGLSRQEAEALLARLSEFRAAQTRQIGDLNVPNDWYLFHIEPESADEDHPRGRVDDAPRGRTPSAGLPVYRQDPEPVGLDLSIRTVGALLEILFDPNKAALEVFNDGVRLSPK